MTNINELKETVSCYNGIWENIYLKKLPSLSSSTAEAAWRYKNFSNIEDLIEDLLKVDPFDHRSVLSIGCGAGKDLEKIKKIFPSANLYGIDTSRYALYEAKKHSDANLVCASADLLPFRDDVKFDGLIAGHVLDLVPNPQNADKIISGLTKHSEKNSRFYITFYWNEYVEDGTCPALELDVCTPIGHALYNSGWNSMCRGTQYVLPEKSPYARGVFWVEEKK